jgi:sulfoxide reductase heme-binding subunit YedZ
MGNLAVWRDYGGRFSWLKLATLLILLWPATAVALAALGHDLGPRPITEAIHRIGDWIVRFLLLALAVTPARAVLDWPRVIQLRRMLGVGTACYAVTHLTLYCLDQKWNLWTVASEIVLRFYLTIGFVTLLTLVTLAITSTDGWQKRLGPDWKRLHMLVYPASALALFHYFLQSKANVTLPVLFTGFWCWLMLWRLTPRRWQARLLLLPPLALMAALATAGIEATWYGLATHAYAERVLFANLDISYGPRPAVQVLIWGMVVFVVAAQRRLVGPRRKAPVREPVRAAA